MAMEYVIQQDTVDRLNSLHDEIHALSRGRYSDMVDARVAAASMAATLQRILEDDIEPLSPDHDYDDDDWDAEYYPDEGKPIEAWSIEPPGDLGSVTDFARLIDPSWFYKKDGSRYRPSQSSLHFAKALLPEDKCSSRAYAQFMRNTEYGGYEEIESEYCPFCDTRKSCVCEAAWSMNGDTLRFHADGWLDKNRRWQRHGLPTIGEIQAERHPVFVCECPWEQCPIRKAAGFADWKAEFLAGL